MTSAIAAFGTLLKMGDGGDPETFTTIAEIVTLPLPAPGVDTEDATSHDSTAGWKEFIPTLLELAEFTLGVNWIPTHATHDASTGLLADLEAKTLRNFQLVLPDAGNTTWSFSAYATGMSGTLDVPVKMDASFTLRPSGQPTLA